MKKVLALVLTLVLVVFALSACAVPAPAPSASAPASQSAAPAPSEPAPSEPAKSEQPAAAAKVAFFVKTLNNPFFVTMQEGAETKAKELGIEVFVDGPPAETEVEKQVAMIENAIVQKYSVIVLAPCAKEPLVPVVKKAFDAGIPVINVDDFIDETLLKNAGAEVAAFIGSDNVAGGKLAGEKMAEIFKDATGEVQVAVIEGMAGVPNSEKRRDGFLEGIKANAKIKVVAQQPADWDVQKGYDVAANIIQANKDLKGIFCCNDQMALGAIKAIEAAGKSKDITLIGYDATDEGRAAVKAGTMVGTVAQYPDDMGVKAMELAAKITKGEKYTANEFIGTKVELITKENA